MNGLLILVALVIGAIALWLARMKLQGTTLLATWWWCAIALLSNCVIELAFLGGYWSDDAVGSYIRYSARMLLLCPGVSLLGAMRPQAGAWSFILVSLWAILALPAAEALFLNTGQPLEIHGARSWFVVVLLLLTCVNIMPTRHWFAALVASSALFYLVSPYLPWKPWGDVPTQTPAAMLALSIAELCFAITRPRITGHPFDNLWLDFRDHFGLFWSLRLQERLLDAAKKQEWMVSPTWFGWLDRDGRPITELDEATYTAIMVTFRGLLRRFVSEKWIEERMK